MTKKFLDNVYDHIGTGVEDFYDTWAATYEAEVAENGYVTPGRCARVLAEHLTPPDAPILDFGCGTGLSGLALRAAGFSVIDGLDLSEKMLAHARTKDVYRGLVQITAGKRLPVVTGSYAAITAIGVIGPGAAPLDVFDILIAALDRGGFLLFSFNDHALEDPVYEAKVEDCVDRGILRLLHREHGPHLPARDIKSTVYLAQKL